MLARLPGGLTSHLAHKDVMPEVDGFCIVTMQKEIDMTQPDAVKSPVPVSTELYAAKLSSKLDISI